MRVAAHPDQVTDSDGERHRLTLRHGTDRAGQLPPRPALDRSALEARLAPFRASQAQEHAHQGGFPGTVRPEDRVELASGDRHFDAIESRDYVVIQGFTLMIAVIFLVVNLLIDISYAWLDPRVKVR